MFYKKRVVRPDTPAEIAWRFADNDARKQAKADADAAFPTITAENFEQKLAYYDARYLELRPK